MRLVKELVAKASKDEEDHLRHKEEQKLFVVRTFANNVVNEWKGNFDFLLDAFRDLLNTCPRLREFPPPTTHTPRGESRNLGKVF